MSKHSWYAFPNPIAPKLWINYSDTVRNALRLYNPYSFKGKLIKKLLSLLPMSLARIFLRNTIETSNNKLNNLTGNLQHLISTDNTTISYSPGTPGQNQKITAQITFEDNSLAYAKIGETDTANKLISNEHNILKMLTSHTLPFIHPDIIAYINADSTTILVQSCPESPLFPMTSTVDEKVIETLCSFSRLYSSKVSIEQCIDEINFKTTDLSFSQKQTIENAKRYLVQTFSNNKVTTHLCHGDFAPWNIMINDNKLFIFDWEYCSKEKPAFFDFVHFIFMPARLVCKRDAKSAVSHVISCLLNPIGSAYFESTGIDKSLVHAYVLLYLSYLFVRDIKNSRDPYIIECIHALLIDANANEPKRILVSVYACEPDEGSEPGVGWNMVNAIATNNEVWAFTKANNKTAIESHLKEYPNPRLHFIYIDLPKWLTFWKKGSRGVRTYYYLWQLRSAIEARSLVRKIDFDHGHHITFVSDWLFTFLALLPIPYVWGPIGSNPLIPSQLAFDQKSLLRDRLRHLIQFTMRFIDPLFWISVIRAKHIIAIEHSIKSQFPFSLVSDERFSYHTAIGVESLPVISSTKDISGKKTLNILTVGKLLPVKGFHLAIEAFSQLLKQHPNAQLNIIGDGPLDKKLRSMCVKLEIDKNVTFVSWMPRNDVLKAMSQADIFLYPTFEGAGMVVLEAMANQLPIVCLDFGGPGIMVDDDCGFRIPITNRAETVKNLANALLHYAEDSKLIKKHGINARESVEKHYLWSNRSDIIQQWYSLISAR